MTTFSLCPSGEIYIAITNFLEQLVFLYILQFLENIPKNDLFYFIFQALLEPFVILYTASIFPSTWNRHVNDLSFTVVSKSNQI